MMAGGGVGGWAVGRGGAGWGARVEGWDGGLSTPVTETQR